MASIVAINSGEALSLFMMALALGMDAFSLGIGIGLRGIRISDIFKLSAIVGLFHVWMPLAGMLSGHFVGSLLGDVALAAGGGLLVLLGLHMIYSAWRGDEDPAYDPYTWSGMVVFAFSVSIDSFSVGVSMGLFATDIWLTVLLFGACGCAMSVLGLLIGSKAGHEFGEYGEALGGVILLVFGLKVLV